MPFATRLSRWILGAALMAPVAAHAAPAPGHAAPHPAAASRAAPAWANRVGLSPVGGHVLGNPAAAHKVVEYMSYTCPHCAHFEEESAAPLRAGPIAGGKVSFEVRHLLRDGVDLAIAMLTNCAPPAQFFALHGKFLAAQPQWGATWQGLPEAQTKAWSEGRMSEQLNRVATDLRLYAIAASAGLPQPRAKACLADQALFQRLVAQSRETDTLHITSTPSFLLDGAVLDDAHDWASLRAKLPPR